LNIKADKKVVLDFDIEVFNFSSFFLDHLSKYGVTDIHQLHLQLPDGLLPNEVVLVGNDQEPDFYKILYQVDPGYSLSKPLDIGLFLRAYKEFIYYLSDQIFKEKLVFQSKPTLRVQFPNNKAVGGFHRDSDYNHPSEEINIWVPITSAHETNTIWLESDYDKEDYTPANLNYGQALIFDSGLKHGNKINIENLTRLSFDFRVIRLSKYKAHSSFTELSVAQHLKFKVGDYYDITD